MFLVAALQRVANIAQDPDLIHVHPRCLLSTAFALEGCPADDDQSSLATCCRGQHHVGHRLVQGRRLWLLVPMFLSAQIRNTAENRERVITTAVTHGTEKALLFAI